MILNPGSGGTEETGRESVTVLLDRLDPGARLSVVGEDGGLLELARRAAAGPAEVVVAAGGDGTVSAVATALAGGEKIFGVLPLGTLNHFATDLGIPAELEAAVDVVAGGATETVDVGEVNGRVFVNNSSLGLYPHIVEERLHQERVRHGKWPALIWATLKVVFRRHPHLHVRIETADREIEAKTQFVFVGNNQYRLTGTDLGGRENLQAGRLSVYLSERSGRLELAALVLRALIGRLRAAPEFREFTTDGLVVETRRDRIRVALDGEVEPMEPPLRYRIRRRALRVRVPGSGS